jgi:hypothetical protein
LIDHDSFSCCFEPQLEQWNSVGGGFPTRERGSGGKVPVRIGDFRSGLTLIRARYPVGEFELKGIRRPMAAYDVLASSSSKPN